MPQSVPLLSLGRSPSYLKQHVHDEHLTTEIAECVKRVRDGRPDSDQYTEHHNTLQESAENGIRTNRKCVAEEEHPDCASDGGESHEDKTELWLTAKLLATVLECQTDDYLLYTLVPLRHPRDDRVTGDSRECGTDHTADERSSTEVSNLGRVVSPWRAGKDAGDDNRRSDIPAVE